jgi:TonB-dependent SusC/RagA subfamily outer membrane receptor
MLIVKSSPLSAQSIDLIEQRFLEQANAFPMEKIHVQTDKPCYMSGEDIRFRIFLVNALSILPDTSSRYVYAELINPLEEVVSRVKIRPEAGVYQGYIPLPEEIAAGNYQLRFYTRFMETQGEDYFFRKRIIIGDPLSSLYYTRAQFTRDDRKKQLSAQLHFSEIKTQNTFQPEIIQVRDEKGIMQTLKTGKEQPAGITLPIKEAMPEALYVEYHYDGKIHKEFIPVEIEDDDFDVAFFPEGGELPAGVRHSIAFKALNTKGLGENISGVILNSANDTLQTFQSEHLGMGVFMSFAGKGEKYHAVCKNDKGIEKSFELPAANDSILSLSVNNLKDRINISVVHSDKYEIPGELYIVAHCRGHYLFSSQWNNSQRFIALDKKILPSGLVQILLTDAQLNPISERLVFVINPKDEAKLSFTSDKPQYTTREAVSIQIQLDSDENQLATGNFSVSVTDNNDLLPDTTINILSTLLLTSELKGYIEDPAYYFRNDNKITSRHLDILMMTQGWRKYDPAALLKGDIRYPGGTLELGTTISGIIKGGLLMTTPAKEYPVSVISLQEGIFGQKRSDNNGRFVFNIPELPDSSRFLVQANTPKGGSRVELLLDSVVYPPVRVSLPVTSSGYNSLFAGYIAKADQKYIQDNGMHTIYLDDVVITANRNNAGKGKSRYSSLSNTIFTSEKIAEINAHSIYDILIRIPGVTVSGKNVSIRNQGTPLLLVDDFETPIEDLDMFAIDDLDELEVVKDAAAAIFGGRGSNGVILLTTKRGFDQTLRRKERFNIKPVIPLGYQTPKEFYSPKYETPFEAETQGIASLPPDLRTTIYWNPAVEFVDGKAQLTFYTSDSRDAMHRVSTTYSIIIEGITGDGRLICSREEIPVE